jgi:hypothetical protein
VKYANEINMKIELDLSSQEAIYRPYLIIDYKEVKGSSIGESTTTPTSFTVEYFMKYDDRISSVYVGLGILCGLSLLWCFALLSCYNKRNPKEAFKGKNSK